MMKSMKKFGDKQVNLAPAPDVRERRPLRTFELKKPNLKVEGEALEALYSSSIEKEMQYYGSLKELPHLEDARNRTEILSKMDQAKLDKKIPWVLTSQHECILSFSTHYLKISERDGMEKLIMRIPIHEIVSCSYIHEDQEHIIALQHGINPEACSLTFLVCSSRFAAEEVCSLVSKCLEIVYQRRVVQMLDDQLMEESSNFSRSSSIISKSPLMNPYNQFDNLGNNCNYYVFSDSARGIQSVANRSGFLSSPPSSASPAPSPLAEAGQSAAVNDLESLSEVPDILQEYMEKLQSKLTTDELHRFAELLQESRSSMPISTFCEKVKGLLGPNRKYLLSGMRHFIPERDFQYFEKFLEKNCVEVDLNDSFSSATSHYRRAMAFHEHQPPIDEQDNVLEEITQNFENLKSRIVD